MMGKPPPKRSVDIRGENGSYNVKKERQESEKECRHPG